MAFEPTRTEVSTGTTITSPYTAHGRCEGRRRAWQLAAVVGLAVLPYLNALQAGFTFDDEPVILSNPGVVHGLDLGWIFASPLFGHLYRPVTVLSYAVNHAATDGRPWSFHATNILLHAAVSVLVFLLAERLFRSVAVALTAAALFAVHPIHTEAVTSIVGRAEVLAALFSLLAILTFMWADVMTSSSGQVVLRVTSALSFLLAVLSKESAASVLPLVFYARIVLRGDPLWRGVQRELYAGQWLAYVACLAVAVGLRQLVLGNFTLGAADGTGGLVPLSRLDNVLGFLPALDRVRSAIAILWDYFGLLNVPVVLSADYSYNQVPIVHSWGDARWLAGAALVAAALATVCVHPRPAVRFAAALPLVTLSVTANVFFPIGTIKAERLLYLPSVGWALLVAGAIVALLRQPRYQRVVMAGLVVTLLAFGLRTWRRNWDWSDNLALYFSMSESAPQSAKARTNCGQALEKRGLDAPAIEQFQAALAIYPEADEAALGIAIAMQRHGQTDEALRWLDRAIALRPDFIMAHAYRCATYLHGGNYAAAAAACRAGLRFEPANAALLKGLGFSLVGLRDAERGHAVLRRALAFNAEDKEIRDYLARAGETAQ